VTVTQADHIGIARVVAFERKGAEEAHSIGGEPEVLLNDLMAVVAQAVSNQVHHPKSAGLERGSPWQGVSPRAGERRIRRDLLPREASRSRYSLLFAIDRRKVGSRMTGRRSAYIVASNKTGAGEGVSQEFFKAAVLAFLKSSKPEVLCIRGRWGTGKTHVWNECLKQAVQAKEVAQPKYAYCSLFGINSLAELKASIVEDSVPVGDFIAPPTMESFNDIYRQSMIKVRQGSWMAKQIVSAIPYVGALGETSARLLFLGVRNQIVCIDDLERKGKDLQIGDVLGLASFLKESRNCKVVLILNDERLEAEVGAFEKYLEKVVDTSMLYAPSAAECVAIGVGIPSSFTPLLSEYATLLEITNIRVIMRVRKLINQLVPVLQERDEKVLREVVKTLTLLGWVQFMPGQAATIEFLKRRHNLIAETILQKRDLSSEEREWANKLDKLAFQTLTTLDEVLLKGMRDGYFDEKLVDSFAQLFERQLKNAQLTRNFTDAWEMYQGSVVPNDDEVVAALLKAGKEGVNRIGLVDMSHTIELLRGIGRNAEASELAQFYARERVGNNEFFQVRGTHSVNTVRDPELREAVRARARVETDDRSYAEVLTSIGQMKNNPADGLFLIHMSSEDFVEAFQLLKGSTLNDAINLTLTNTDRASNGQTVGANVRVALERLSAQSPMNRARVEGYIAGATQGQAE